MYKNTSVDQFFTSYLTPQINVRASFISYFQVFNLGDYRREEAVKSKDNAYTNHAVFDPNNKEGREMRERICHRGLEDVLEWLENNNGEVAVFDATNTTRERRKYLYSRVVIEKGGVLRLYK